MLKRIFNILVGGIVFSILYVQLSNENFKQAGSLLQELSFNKLLYTFLVLLFLMLINWGLEALKWFLIIEKLYSIRFAQAFKAVLVGNTYGVFTPNRVGEIVGRVFFLGNLNKGRITLLSLVGSASMTIAGLILGVLALFYFPLKLALFVKVISLCLLLLSIFIYYKIGLFLRWITKFKWWKQYADYSSTLKFISFKDLTFYVLLSMVRYWVFIFQYVFLLQMFLEEVDFLMVGGGLSIVYMVQSFIPTPVVIELGVRGSLAVFILGSIINAQNLIIVSVAYIIWFINMLIPAILGYIFVLRKK